MEQLVGSMQRLITNRTELLRLELTDLAARWGRAGGFWICAAAVSVVAWVLVVSAVVDLLGPWQTHWAPTLLAAIFHGFAVVFLVQRAMRHLSPARARGALSSSAPVGVHDPAAEPGVVSPEGKDDRHGQLP